jgi:hypothetical protein
MKFLNGNLDKFSSLEKFSVRLNTILFQVGIVYFVD